MSGHTPGPWYHWDSGDLLGVGKNHSDEADILNAVSQSNRPRSEDLANMLLIAAAPDLLEALEAFDRIKDIWLPGEAEEQHAEEMYALHMARNNMLAAIARAKGEA